MTTSERWSDLSTRLLTGGLLAAGGALAIVLGGSVFVLVIALTAGILVWELTLMVAPEVKNRSVIFALLSALAVAMATDFDREWAIGLALLPAILGLLTLGMRRWLFFAFALAIQGAAYELVVFRDAFGVKWLLWLLLVVIATDICGYFAGRIIGGPKFWPKVSPKKTWAGIIAGWAGAAAVGLVFILITGAGPIVMILSVALSFASQMGDAAESALKRYVGVKDSSDILPGHGGVFDRFDGVLGASILMLLIAQVTTTPGLI
ncbi:MAG: phosphatidate cytidylyltransferase [Pseudomonadota bacterium]